MPSPSNPNNGLYFPQLTTTQRNAIPVGSLKEGEAIYNTDTDAYEGYRNTSWITIANGSSGGDVNGPPSSITNNVATFADTTGKLIKDSTISINDIYSAGHPTTLIDTTSTFTYNFFAGTSAGNSTLTGARNTGVGSTVLNKLTSGNYNTGYGNGVLLGVTTASNNCAFGTLALTNGNGSSNCAFGFSALSNNISGSQNISIGYQSLFNNNSNNNVAIGHLNLVANVNGSDNISIGTNSQRNGINSSQNISLGSNSLQTSSSGGANIAIGGSALFSSNNNSNNTAVGVSSLTSLGNATGSGNTAVGRFALASVTKGDNNVSIGFSSGNVYSNCTGCTFLGANAAPFTQGLSNSTAIGYNAIVFTSNSIVLGNGCNIGIGSNSPAYSLHLGNDNSSVPLIHMESTVLPSAPSTNNGIFSVNSGRPYFTSGTSTYTGTLTTAQTIGSAATCGTVSLTGITAVTISTTSVKTGSQIFLTHSTLGTTPTLANVGTLTVGDIINSTSFKIYSTNAADTSSAYWFIINQ